MKWPTVKLQDLAEQSKGAIVSGPFGSNISAKFFVEEGVPVIRGNNLSIGQEKFIDDGFVFLTVSKATEFSNCEAITDDIIFTAAGSIGQVGIIPNNTKYPKYIISNKQLRVRVDKAKASPPFIYYCLSTREMTRYIIGLNNGGAVPLINLGIIRKLPIPLPPLETQNRIVGIISAYDDLIENNRRRIQLLEQSAKLLYKEWFVYLRFPGHEHASVVNGVPDGWEKKRIGELCAYLNRGIAPEYDDEGELLVINQKCIRNGILALDLARRQNREFAEEKQVRIGDVLINSTGTGTLGRVAQVCMEIEKCTVDSHVTIVRPLQNYERFWFGFTLLPLEPLFESMGEGATNQTELKRQKIYDVQVLTPARNLRKQFEEFAVDVVIQISNLAAQNAKLKQARDLLLPRLMNGAIKV